MRRPFSIYHSNSGTASLLSTTRARQTLPSETEALSADGASWNDPGQGERVIEADAKKRAEQLSEAAPINSSFLPRNRHQARESGQGWVAGWKRDGV